MAKDFMNRDNVYDGFLSLFKEVTKNYGYDIYEYESFIEEYTFRLTEKTLYDMKQYCHRKDTKMCGNFCNIREDWEETQGFIDTEIKPWGKFDDVVKSIDEETISDEDLEKFQEWALDWYYTAFGTFGLKYNFGDFLMMCVEELEKENEDAA